MRCAGNTISNQRWLPFCEKKLQWVSYWSNAINILEWLSTILSPFILELVPKISDVAVRISSRRRSLKFRKRFLMGSVPQVTARLWVTVATHWTIHRTTLTSWKKLTDYGRSQEWIHLRHYQTDLYWGEGIQQHQLNICSKRGGWGGATREWVIDQIYGYSSRQCSWE